MSIKFNSVNDNGLADFLRDWNPDDPDGKLFDGDGREITGEEKKEIMNIMRKMAIIGPFHSCRIINLNAYRKKKALKKQ